MYAIREAMIPAMIEIRNSRLDIAILLEILLGERIEREFFADFLAIVNQHNADLKLFFALCHIAK